MPYIRHRARMVQESVFEDLANTLIACRWMVGTTSRSVFPAEGPIGAAPAAAITTTSGDVYPLAQDHPVQLLDYFPEAQGEITGATPLNTMAMDNGRPGEATQLELGSNTLEQPYVFNLAFYAVSDAVADAVLSDLKDRYEGRLVNHEVIELYDYNVTPDAAVAYMEIDGFRYTRDTDNVSPAEVHLFFAELQITDIVET